VLILVALIQTLLERVPHIIEKKEQNALLILKILKQQNKIALYFLTEILLKITKLFKALESMKIIYI
jgi:hypothetical protein